MINALIVDAYNPIAQMIKKDLKDIFGDEHINVKIVESGLYGKFEINYSINVIFVDSKLPDMDGVKFIKEIRNRATYVSDIPIIIVGMPEEEELFKQLVIDYDSISYLIKGFDIEDVKTALSDIRIL